MSAIAHDFVAFLNACPSPYHTVSTAKNLLLKAGFTQLSENSNWSTNSSIKPGGRYFVTRNGSSIIAFALGKKWQAGSPAAMVGAHTDSPCLRLKPRSMRSSEGYLQVGVETYGGGIWHSWFDRDLSLAGRVMVEGADGTYQQQLLRIDKPLLRIPTLAIHLDRTQNEAFKFNNETQMTPILGTVAAQLNAAATTPTKAATVPSSGLLGMPERHHPVLLELIRKELSLSSIDQINDFELVLYDTQKACLGGINDEFVFSARLDNLGCTYASLRGLVDSLDNGSDAAEDSLVRLVSCFDHEEIGSLSQQGADSNFLPAVLERINGSPASTLEGNSASFLISADMAHAVNPNYLGNYESEHKPRINEGVVIKVNANQRYTTNAPGIVLIDKVAQKAGAKLQSFVVRQDSACGGTIGPMLAAKLGVRTIDLGNPQLSMHSIRETGGSQDVDHLVKLLSTFFTEYQTLSTKIFVD
ncbi:Aspartyl aminopeptidase [Taphrina deformans PYCC 5710]|uniref:aspartyl aminopeptidase n=1 Tax=Taphrina deformans (strain PYCC 5710 / ATCC 11124 / CBS 356.35 / IMI 108563 / JCM 9778 / NBRC 8474) TaxID=1097556 RepID=R4XCC6_TAPDE|nr:Aspartyl aminopeptidase [Taphrina deformans PYCC 5710]|eukprot:CCG83236.1 Aspartyl aminopeptidase [Taphrina deformans PYCC 5710]